jgi:hypothetical protein
MGLIYGVLFLEANIGDMVDFLIDANLLIQAYGNLLLD